MRKTRDLQGLGVKDLVLLWLCIGIFRVLWVVTWPIRRFFPLIPNGPKPEE